MKKAVALCLAAVLVLSLAAGAFAEGRKFGACYITNSPFFIAVNDTIKAVIEEENGDTLITLDPERDQEKQIRQINDLIAQGIAALFLTPVDGEGITPALLACREAGIPVINVDSAVQEEDLVTCIIASDNHAAGQFCGEDLLSRIKGGKIAILENSTAKTGFDRIAAFEEAVKDRPDFTIAIRGDSRGKRDIAESVMKDILQKVPDIAAVMCVSDSVALGAVAALKEAGALGRVLVYGVNGSPEAKKAIRDGIMTGTAGQSARNIGHIAASIAYRALDGKQVEKYISAPVLMINADNLHEFFLDGWQ